MYHNSIRIKMWLHRIKNAFNIVKLIYVNKFSNNISKYVNYLLSMYIIFVVEMLQIVLLWHIMIFSSR